MSTPTADAPSVRALLSGGVPHARGGSYQPIATFSDVIHPVDVKVARARANSSLLAWGSSPPPFP